MKASKLLVVAFFIASMFAFSACEDEQIVLKNTDGEQQADPPVDHGDD